GRIVARAAEGAEVVDCSRFLVVPGMVNAHNHSNENWFRGMWDNLPLEPWMLFSYPTLAAPSQSPEEIYLRTVFGALEQLRSGATCVVDFLYELDGFTTESLEAVVRGYRDAGLRALIALGIETRMQAVSGRRMYGKTLVEHMDAIGFLSPRVVLAHGIWLTPGDIELVRDRGVTVAHNPASNLKLGSGLAAVPTLLAEGVN